MSTALAVWEHQGAASDLFAFMGPLTSWVMLSAVLPFTPLSPDPNSVQFAQAIVIEGGNQIQRGEAGVDTVSRSSRMRYGGWQTGRQHFRPTARSPPWCKGVVAA